MVRGREGGDFDCERNGLDAVPVVFCFGFVGVLAHGFVVVQRRPRRKTMKPRKMRNHIVGRWEGELMGKETGLNVMVLLESWRSGCSHRVQLTREEGELCQWWLAGVGRCQAMRRAGRELLVRAFAYLSVIGYHTVWVCKLRFLDSMTGLQPP